MNSVAKGLLSYLLGVIGPLIVILAFQDNTRKDLFHAYQSLVITIGSVVAYLACAIIGFIPIVQFITVLLIPAIMIFLLVLTILGIVKVCKDDPDPKLVLVGGLTESIFGKQINAAPDVAVAPQQPSFDPNTGQPVNQPAPQAPVEQPAAPEAPAPENNDQNL